MIFEVRSDFVYSRLCLVKGRIFRRSAKQHIVIRPARPLYFRLSGAALCACLFESNDLASLFSASPLGNPLFRIYSSESMERGSYGYVHGADDVPSRFVGLDFEEFKSEVFWMEEDLETIWAEGIEQYEGLSIDKELAFENGFAFPEEYSAEDILPFFAFKKAYVQDREFQIIDQFVTANDGSRTLVDHNSVEAKGARANGIWYPEDFVLQGFENISSIKLRLPNSDLLDVHDVEQLKRVAQNEV